MSVFCNVSRISVCTSVSFLNAVYEGEKLAWNAKDASNCRMYLKRCKVARRELSVVMVPGGGTSAPLHSWRDINVTCRLLMSSHQLHVQWGLYSLLLQGFLTHYGETVDPTFAPVRPGQTPSPASLEGLRLAGCCKRALQCSENTKQGVSKVK